MSTLVTGPDGFVGSEICRELLARGKSTIGAQWRPAPLADGCKSVVVGNIGPHTDWSSALQDVTTVVHLAARVHIMDDTATDPLAEFRAINVEGTRHLATCAAEASVRRFVFLSSIKVNGEETRSRNAAQDRHPGASKLGSRIPVAFIEADEPNPQDPYAVSKWEAEQVLCDIGAKTGMEIVILRPPLIYGPGVKANFLKLIQLIDRGIPLPVGGIKNSRSLLGLSNLADLICTCVDYPDAAGKTFVVSDNDDVSTPELVQRIAKALGKKPRLLPVPESAMRLAGKVTGKSAQVQRLCSSLQVDSSYVRETLNWTPPCNMAGELERVAEWYRSVVR